MLKAISYIALIFCTPLMAAENPLAARNTVTLLETRGVVSVQRGGATVWAPAKVGDVLKIGDSIRTGEDSWVALRLSDLSVIRKGPWTAVTIQPPVTGGEP